MHGVLLLLLLPPSPRLLRLLRLLPLLRLLLRPLPLLRLLGDTARARAREGLARLEQGRLG